MCCWCVHRDKEANKTWKIERNQNIYQFYGCENGPLMGWWAHRKVRSHASVCVIAYFRIYLRLIVGRRWSDQRTGGRSMMWSRNGMKLIDSIATDKMSICWTFSATKKKKKIKIYGLGRFCFKSIHLLGAGRMRKLSDLIWRQKRRGAHNKSECVCVPNEWRDQIRRIPK